MSCSSRVHYGGTEGCTLDLWHIIQFALFFTSFLCCVCEKCTHGFLFCFFEAYMCTRCQQDLYLIICNMSMADLFRRKEGGM